MALVHPIDDEVRARLKAAAPHQADFAKAIGRSPAWLNKYMQGVGNATIDDVIRIAALLIGTEMSPALSKPARKLLRALEQLEAEDQEDGAEFFAAWVQMRQRRQQQKESPEPAADKAPAAKRRVREKR